MKPHRPTTRSDGCKHCTSDGPWSLIDRFDDFLLDLDGVVYVGREAVTGSVEAIAELRRRGKQLRAQRAGYASVLACSGHTDRRELERSEIRPDYVVERLVDVLDTAGTVDRD